MIPILIPSPLAPVAFSFLWGLPSSFVPFRRAWSLVSDRGLRSIDPLCFPDGSTFRGMSILKRFSLLRIPKGPYGFSPYGPQYLTMLLEPPPSFCDLWFSSPHGIPLSSSFFPAMRFLTRFFFSSVGFFPLFGSFQLFRPLLKEVSLSYFFDPRGTNMGGFILYLAFTFPLLSYFLSRTPVFPSTLFPRNQIFVSLRPARSGNCPVFFESFFLTL